VSDIMISRRITIRIPQSLRARLRERCRVSGHTLSHLTRVALKDYLRGEIGSRSAYNLAQDSGLIGCVRHAPKDLSTNRNHFAGFRSGNA